MNLPRLLINCAALGLFTAVVSGPAHALNVDWTFNFSDAADALGAVIADSGTVDELKFTAEGIVAFHDLDNDGTISTNDTFDDFVVLRIDQLFDNGVDNSPLSYGGPNGDHELTIILQLTGTQTDNQNFVVDDITQFDVWFDAGQSYTFADFASLGTFDNGIIVETGDDATQPTTGGGTNALNIPDGAIDLKVALTDILSTLNGQYTMFEQEFDPPVASLDLITAVTDSNNNRCVDSGGTASCNSTIAALAGFFGADLVSDYDFFFHTKSDGSAVKSIPEPAIIALLGLGMIGFGLKSRRKA